MLYGSFEQHFTPGRWVQLTPPGVRGGKLPFGLPN